MDLYLCTADAVAHMTQLVGPIHPLMPGGCRGRRAIDGVQTASTLHGNGVQAALPRRVEDAEPMAHQDRLSCLGDGPEISHG